MKRIGRAAAIAALVPLSAFAQEVVGTLTMDVEGEKRPFVVIQGAEGANPGSRYSRLAGDVVVTLVAVRGDQAVAPKDAAETVELRFTVDEAGSEVRTGSVMSYSTKDADGMPSTRGGTAEIALDSLEAEEAGVSASGSFVAQLPPDQMSEITEIEGTFDTAMKPREAP